MAVTDLTGTKWYFNQTIGGNSQGSNLNFLSNDTEYQGFQFNGSNTFIYATKGLSGGFHNVWSSNGGWQNEAYRTIEITGGNDATNSALIAWLQANATQIQDEPNTFSFGNLPIENVYFGTRQVKKIYMGNALVWEKEESANLISFSINGTTYHATEGMTWQEWCASEYNTGGLVVVNGEVRTGNSPSACVVVTNCWQTVTPSDIIRSEEYEVAGGGDD